MFSSKRTSQLFFFFFNYELLLRQLAINLIVFSKNENKWQNLEQDIFYINTSQ